jgi:HD-GYP domain-containing protein (c-di-GMP phosphodiesterase class II)
MSDRRQSAFDPLSEQLLVEAREREAARLTRAERLTYLISSAGFAVVALLLLVLGREAPLPDAWIVGVLVVSYALASRLEFEVGSTLAIASELILVEMMFLLPPAQLPLWVVAGTLLGQLPDYLRRTVPLERTLIVVGSSWYAFGPAIVLALFPVTPSMETRALLVVALALAAQFGVDLFSSALREWAALRVSPRQLASQMALVFSIDLALAPLGLLAAIASVHDPAALLLPLPLLFMIGLSTRERQRSMDQAIELSSAYRGTAFLLGDVVEADDEYTGAHSRDVVDLVLAVCDEMKVDARSRLDAEFVALLHDVGKINVPAEIIHKPGPLDPEERTIMNLHTIEGERLLQRVGGRLGEVGGIVRSCHERWDGNGYPDGLAGAEIPLVARIVCACDAFSAMTTNRSYRAARSVPDALAELEACVGTHFDPQVVSALAAAVRSGPEWATRPADLLAAAEPRRLAA